MVRQLMLAYVFELSIGNLAEVGTWRNLVGEMR